MLTTIFTIIALFIGFYIGAKFSANMAIEKFEKWLRLNDYSTEQVDKAKEEFIGIEL